MTTELHRTLMTRPSLVLVDLALGCRQQHPVSATPDHRLQEVVWSRNRRGRQKNLIPSCRRVVLQLARGNEPSVCCCWMARSFSFVPSPNQAASGISHNS